MIQWESDKRWADRFIPEIKRILAEMLIDEAPLEEDVKHNTDLIVLRNNNNRIACRVRRYSYIQYSDEFTIRYSRQSGAKTEFGKLIEGWGDYLFYGISDKECKYLTCWFVGDLRVFRRWLMIQLYRGPENYMPGIEKRNPDQSSTFRVFQKKEMPPDFIVLEKEYNPEGVTSCKSINL